MTLQQLEYIVALDKTRHFVRAAELCGVTQPTLSAMVQKIEDELDCRIFDRSKQPLVPTQAGQLIISQAQIILYHVNQLKENVQNRKMAVQGNLNIAIIPTVAPYLLPKFISQMHQNYPDIELKVSESHTDTIIQKLLTAELDMAILSTPLENHRILEVPLYYEKFELYVSPGDPLSNISEIAANELPLNSLWVLEEGHCFRNQVFNFCQDNVRQASVYESGSIDTLVKIVDENGGYTVIPELHIDLLNDKQKNNIRKVLKPEAYREISLVIRHDYVREGMMNAVANSIKKIIPPHMLNARLKKFSIKL